MQRTSRFMVSLSLLLALICGCNAVRRQPTHISELAHVNQRQTHPASPYYDVDTLNYADKLQCHCTQAEQCEAGKCFGDLCVIGYSKNGKLVKGCVSGMTEFQHKRPAILCTHKFGPWADICICGYSYCNKFKLYRERFDDYRISGAPLTPGERTRLEHLVQQPLRQSYPPTSAVTDHDRRSSETGRGEFVNGGQLSMLLIVIPIAIGCIAIAIVVFNYYCKQC